MRVQDVKDWKAIHFQGRTILRKDLKYMPYDQAASLLDVEIEPIEGRKGHYRTAKRG